MNGPGKHRKNGWWSQWGPREILAFLIVIGALSLALIATISHDDRAIPPWVAILLGGIGVFYFKTNGKNGKGGGGDGE